MKDLSHWDLTERFTATEAASLIAGEDPAHPHNEWWRAKPATERLSAAYERTLAVVTYELPCEMAEMLEAIQRATDGLPSFQLEACIVNGDDVMDWYLSPKAEFNAQSFERSALHRWLQANRIPSAYAFASPNGAAVDATQEPSFDPEPRRAVIEQENERVRRESTELRERANAQVHEFLEKNPADFSKCICTYIVADELPNDPLINLWAADPFRSNLRDNYRPRFRFLAEAILDKLGGGPVKHGREDAMSLAEFARKETQDQCETKYLHLRLKDVDLLDPSSTVWAYFDLVKSGLTLAHSTIADWADRGLPLYEEQGKQLHMVPDDHAKVIFLRESAKVGGLADVYEPPQWMHRFFVKHDEVRLYGVICDFDKQPSDEEVLERRGMLRKQLGIPHTVCSPIPSAPGKWPWGAHTTAHLAHLEAAATKFWSLYDPKDPSTAPTNEMVAEWLMVERKVSNDKARAIASILRADGLPTGPRK